MITKIREMILTRMDAEERAKIRQSEKERLSKECTLSILTTIVTIALSIAAVVVMSMVMDEVAGKEFAFGWLSGIGIMAVCLTIACTGAKIRRFDPPTAEEMNELGDRIR